MSDKPPEAPWANLAGSLLAIVGLLLFAGLSDDVGREMGQFAAAFRDAAGW